MLHKNFFATRSASSKGAGLMEYGVMVAVIAISSMGAVSVAGEKIRNLYFNIGEEVAYLNREIATINIAMDDASGTWEIVSVSVDPVDGDQDAPDNKEPLTESNGSDPNSDQEPQAEEEDQITEDQAASEDEAIDADPEESDEGVTYDNDQSTEVAEEEKGAPIPHFELTHNNGKNQASIDFSKIDVPHRAYEFTLSGTGNTRPRAKAFSDGSDENGLTLTDRIQIMINKPAKGAIETITLIIAGQTLTWTVAHDNGKRK